MSGAPRGWKGPKRVTSAQFDSQMRRRKRKSPSNKALNRKIKRIEHRQEIKFHDVGTTLAPTNAGTFYTVVNGIAGGDDDQLRDGNMITATSYVFRAILQLKAVSVPHTVRLIIYMDKETGGLVVPAPLVGADGTQSILNSTPTLNPTLMPYNRNTVGTRYKILIDKTFVCNADTITVAPAIVGHRIFFKKKIRLNHKVRYKDNTGLPESINHNRLVVAWFGEIDTAQVDVTWNGRFNYKDF